MTTLSSPWFGLGWWRTRRSIVSLFDLHLNGVPSCRQPRLRDAHRRPVIIFQPGMMAGFANASAAPAFPGEAVDAKLTAENFFVEWLEIEYPLAHELMRFDVKHETSRMCSSASSTSERLLVPSQSRDQIDFITILGWRDFMLLPRPYRGE